jgi:hypothetical protein
MSYLAIIPISRKMVKRLDHSAKGEQVQIRLLPLSHDYSSPALNGIKSPARLATTSDGFLIVHVRPERRTRQNFSLGLKAALSGT